NRSLRGKRKQDVPTEVERKQDEQILPDKSHLEFPGQIELDTKVDAIIKDVLYPGDTAALWGESSVGKTFLATDLGFHVALGNRWHNLKVPKALSVLYVGLEGGRGLRRRILACKRKLGDPGKMFARLLLSPRLCKGGLGDEGQKIIIAYAKLLEKINGVPVGLIVIDTVARAMAPDDGDSNQDMSAYADRKAAISQATGAAVLSLHHPGKKTAAGMRGAYAFYAACDCVIKITGGHEGIREVYAEKVKDGEERPLFSFKLTRCELGQDDDGDPITTCVVELTDP